MSACLCVRVPVVHVSHTIVMWCLSFAVLLQCDGHIDCAAGWVLLISFSLSRFSLSTFTLSTSRSLAFSPFTLSLFRSQSLFSPHSLSRALTPFLSLSFCFREDEQQCDQYCHFMCCEFCVRGDSVTTMRVCEIECVRVRVCECARVRVCSGECVIMCVFGCDVGDSACVFVMT